MTQFAQHIQTVWTYLRSPRVHPFVIAMPLIATLSTGVAYIEYQTNWFARRLGALLLSTNTLRPQTGTLWEKILAQSQTQQDIHTSDALPTSQAGLPKPVTNNRFEISRVPDTGLPGYVAIYKTPLPNPALNARPLGEAINSLRIYRQGLSIVKALQLPDVNFHAQIHSRVENLYADIGDFQPISIYTTAIPDNTVQIDSLGVLDPDSLKAAVFAELATEMIPSLKQREKTTIISAYEDGEITQIFLNRDLGRFRGELHFEEDRAPAGFEIDVHAVIQIMNLPQTSNVSSDDQP